MNVLFFYIGCDDLDFHDNNLIIEIIKMMLTLFYCLLFCCLCCLSHARSALLSTTELTPNNILTAGKFSNAKPRQRSNNQKHGRSGGKSRKWRPGDDVKPTKSKAVPVLPAPRPFESVNNFRSSRQGVSGTTSADHDLIFQKHNRHDSHSSSTQSSNNIKLQSLSISIAVQYTEDDFPANADFCYPQATPSCNLRSAWVACETFVTMNFDSSCLIMLPLESQLSWNVSYGAVHMPTVGSIAIQGQGATITPTGSNTEPVVFINTYESEQLIYTNNAMYNTEQTCVLACANTLLTFSSCNNYTGNPFFRLYLGEVEVASNDNACGYGAEINYYIQQGTPCAEYCLEIGCSEDGACQMEVDSYQQAAKDPQVISYYNTMAPNVTDGIESVPKLSVGNMTFINFANYAYGGVLYLNGNLTVDLIALEMIQIRALRGGAIAILNNYDVANKYIASLQTTYVSASDFGGVLYLYNTTNVMLLASDLNAGASQFGGAIAIQSGCSDILIRNLTISNFNAVYGAGIGFGQDNHHISVSNLVMSNLIASGNGAAFSFYAYNAFINIHHVSLKLCSAYNGAGFWVNSNQHHLNMTDVTMSNMTVSNAGAGMFISESQYIYMQQWKLNYATASYAGTAVYLETTNSYIYMLDCFFSHLELKGGGGALYMGGGHHHIYWLGGGAQHVTTTDSGGVVFAVGFSYTLVFEDLFIDDISLTSLADGGVFNFMDSINGITIQHLRISNIVVSQGQAGGFIFASNIHDISINDVTMTNVSASNYGGILYISTNSSNLNVNELHASNLRADYACSFYMVYTNGITVTNSSIRNCIGISGANFLIDTENSNIVLNNVVFSHHESPGAVGGAALTVNQNNAHIHLLNCSFLHGDAVSDSGAIYLNSDNTDIAIAGCLFQDNSCGDSGGAIYASQDNSQLVLMDLEGYQQMQVLQSEHPYQIITGSDDPVIYSTTVDVPGAMGFVINFDELTTIQDSLTSITIYDSVNKTEIFYQDTSGWPGVSVPSLYVPAGSFYLEFLGPVSTQFRITSGLYGFKLYAYPVMEQANYPTIFENNIALSKGGAIQLFYSNMFSVFIHNIFSGNQATDGDGGALSLQVGQGGTYLVQCLFYNNSVSSHGGAVSLSAGQFGIVFRNVTFMANKATLQGGALYLGTGNGDGVLWNDNQIALVDSWFENNAVSAGGGGAVFANDDNTLYLTNVDLRGNSALGDDGGALSLSYNNMVTSKSLRVHNNTAGSHCGGGLASLQSNYFDATSTSWTDNSAQSGGGICAKGDTSLSFFQDTLFSGNVASLGGGAILLIESFFPSLSEDGYTRHFLGNVAPRGSAILLYKLADLYIETAGLVFENNVAVVGGTVYWVCDATMPSAPEGLDSPDIVWLNNTAGYASTYGTQAMYLLTPEQYYVTVYAAPINPPISISMVDYYQQYIPLTGQTTVYPEVTTSYNCQVYPYLAGNDIYGNGVIFQQGLAVFNNLETYCYPGDFLMLHFEARLGSAIGLPEEKMKPYYISNYTTLHFRYCVSGEYIVNGVCKPCPVSTYSMEVNSMQCTSCTGVEGVEACNTNQIVVEEGYWRRYDTNTAVMRCLLNAASCPGGNNTGDSSCGVGYSGPLCAVCLPGYFQQDDSCVPCTADNKVSPTLIALLIIVSLIIGLVVWYLYYEYSRIDQKKKNAKDFVEANMHSNPTATQHAAKVQEGFEDNDDEEAMAVIDLSASANDEDELNTVQIIILWIRIKYELLMVKIKIIVSTFQVVTSTAVIFDVQMPPAFTKFSNSFQFFNLGLSSLIPWGCTSAVSFMDTLLWTTITPILISFLILLALGIEVCVLRLRPDPSTKPSTALGEVDERGEPSRSGGKEEAVVVSKKVQYEEIKSKYLNYFFYLTYLVLPSVTTTIFQLFICTNVDPDHEDFSTDDYYLTADMTISCETSYYYNWVGYAVVMIFVYPIGIPLMYLVLLYRNRTEILQREDEPSVEDGNEDRQSNSSASFSWHASRPSSMSRSSAASSQDTAKDAEAENTMSPSAARLAFLWQAYEPQFWYWEIVETSRRIILTAVLSICSPGSSAQSVLSVLLSLTYIKIYGYYQPYVDDSDDWLAEMGQFQIFFTYFTALVVQNGLLGNSFDTLLGVLLSMINLGVILLAFYVEIKAYRDDIKASKAREQEEKKKRALMIHQHRLDFAKKVIQGGSAQTSEGSNKVQFQRKTTKEVEASTENSRKRTTSNSTWEEVRTPMHPPAAAPTTSSSTSAGMPMFKRGGGGLSSSAPKEVELQSMDSQRSKSVESATGHIVNRVSKIKLDSDDEDSDDN